VKIGVVARNLGVPVPTLRRWTQEFADGLSPEARGGDGRPREFNVHDQRVLRRVREILSDPDATYAQARRRLIDEELLSIGPVEALPDRHEAAPQPTAEEREAAERFVQAILDRIAQPWLQRLDHLENEISSLRQELASLQVSSPADEPSGGGRRRWPFG